MDLLICGGISYFSGLPESLLFVWGWYNMEFPALGADFGYCGFDIGGCILDFEWVWWI